MPKLTAESFFNLIQQSGLIEHSRLQPLIEKMQQAGVDMTDSAAVSAWLVEHGPLTQWQTNKLLQGKHKGFTLGKYKLMELLGKGGMSSVYLAEHQLMRRRCAIKVLPMKRVNDSSYLERFHREARAVASLDHPNVVRAYDIDHELDGDRAIHFLVMEYVKGQSIQDIVKDHGVVSIENAAEYFRQAALGLESAHKSGLVHRDVKPGNLLVDLGGVVKVLDLGLARFNESTDESGAPLTVAHDEKVLGTADYLAPEQALDSHSVDHRADIYALGCTMYFALTGHPPFREGTLTQRLMWHQVKEPPEISESRPEVDQTDAGRALVAIIKKLMAKPVGDRHQSMKEVSDVLFQWLKQYAGADWHARNTRVDSGAPAGHSSASVAEPAASPPVAQAVPAAVPVNVPAAPAVATGGWSPNAPTADAVPVVAAFAPDETIPTAEILADEEDPEPADAGDASTPGEITAPVADQSTDEFDPGLIPDPVSDDDEFPSLLGGTPTAAVPGLSDGQATATSLAPTQTFIPADHPSGGGDATVITPVDDSGLPPAAAPVFPGAGPAAPAFAAPTDAAPAFAAPVAPNAAPQFPGSEATPAFPQAPAAPAFPDAPAAPAFPGAPAPGFDPNQAAVPAVPAAPLAQPAAVPGTTPARAAKKPLPVPMIAGIVIAVLAVGGGIYMATSGGGDDPANGTETTRGGTQTTKGGTSGGDGTGTGTTTTGSGSQPVGYVIKVGPEGNFQTLKELFANLKTNKDSYDRASRRQKINVTVVGGTTFDGINIDNSKEDYPKGIHLVADGVTRPKLKGSGSGPVVRLVALEDFRLEGFDIDASGKDVAIEVAGMVPGTTFLDLQISGYRKIGIHGLGAVGLNGDELIIEKVDLRPGDAASVGIRLNGEGDNESMRTFVRNCRMFGPQESGVVIDGGCNYVELRENVIDQANVGVHLTGGTMSWRDLTIGNVTFYECSKAGIAFSDMPMPGGGFSGTSIAFCRNLFAKCSGPELLIEKGFTTEDHDKQFDRFLSENGSIEQNWTDRQEPARVESGERELVHREPFEGNRRQRVPLFSFASTDRNSADFLATKNGTPYANVGGPKLKTKKYIGAVAPKQ